MATIVQNVAIGGNSQPSPTVFNFTTPPTAGNQIGVGVSSWPSRPTSIIVGGVTSAGVTVGGVTLTEGPSAVQGSGDDVSLWYGTATSGLSTEIAVRHVAGGPDFLYYEGAATEFSGGAAVPEAIGNTAAGTSNAPAVSTTGAITGTSGILFANWSNGSDGNQNAAGTPAGWTQWFGTLSDEGGDGSYKIISGASGVQSVTFSVNGGGSASWLSAIMYWPDAASPVTSVSFSGLTVQVA